jgi:hypothetical protein
MASKLESVALAQREHLKKLFCEAYQVWQYHTTNPMSRCRDIDLSWRVYCQARDQWIQHEDESEMVLDFLTN